jgi:hypothetical protein
LSVLSAGGFVLRADAPPGEGPVLGSDRVTQEEIEDGSLGFDAIREAGLRLFTSSFNKLDGYGDGPMDPADPVSPGGRPTLQGNGTFLRVNGLDAQSCQDCHAIVSALTVPPTLGIGGVGPSAANALIMPTLIDPGDLLDSDGAAAFDGRFANPPFLFGVGGVELLSLEMTEDLQALKRQAIASPGTIVPLVTKGVSFGRIVADANGVLDTSAVEGIDPDLIVRALGRKGDFPSVRDFDIAAMQFHFGMQPVEVVGADHDADGDGVENEILSGELSALHAFLVTMPRPQSDPLTSRGLRGFRIFREIGCVDCHKPALETRSKRLPLRFPADPADPSVNVYAKLDLTREPAGFGRNGSGGLIVPLFADLKRHDMGDGLAETFHLAGPERNREFTTARLWGVADTAPYLHDGRATTLTEAILAHGGEAQAQRDAFAALNDSERVAILTFLRSLRTPGVPSRTRGGGDGRFVVE